MPANVTKYLPHILLRDTAKPEPYTNPTQGGGSKFLLKSRDRKLHGERLREQLRLIQEQAASLVDQHSAIGVRSDIGLTIQFESDPGYPLKVESLEYRRSGIEVMNVQELGETEKTTFATVHVPKGKLEHFFKMIEDYLNEINKKSQKPKNKKLIESIANIKLASLKAFWADTESFDDIAWFKKSSLGRFHFSNPFCNYCEFTIFLCQKVNNSICLTNIGSFQNNCSCSKGVVFHNCNYKLFFRNSIDELHSLYYYVL